MISAILLLVTMSSAAIASTRPPGYWYASPADFKVPPVVRRRLERSRCAIPQSGAEGPLQNVTSGHFVTKKRVDYAALCSDHVTSRVLVIHGTSGEIIARLNPQPDADHMMPFEAPAGMRHLFVREIDRVEARGRQYCLDESSVCACTGKTLDGIVDVYEKWSETHCWQRGWHTVTSGD
jgi:hypothetical protein